MKKNTYNKRFSSNEKNEKNNKNTFFYQSVAIGIIAIGLYSLNHFNNYYASQVFQIINNTINVDSQNLTAYENFQIEEQILEQIEQNEREREAWGEE